MIRFSHYKNAPYPIEKISHLHQLLRDSAKHYEVIIVSMDNAKMRDILHRLAITSNQFASALCLRIPSFAETPGIEAGDNEPLIEQRKTYSEQTALDFFTVMEKSMVNAYRDVLHQPFIDTEFRQMINFQLGETLYLFMHLKLMHSLKVRMY